MSDVFRAERIGKSYRGMSVLREFDLELAAGQCTVLLGRNGAGKSTLLRMALGVVRPEVGRLTVLGRDPMRRARELRQRIGYVPDMPDAPRWMRFGELCRFHRAHYASWNQTRAEQLAEQFAVPVATRLGEMSRGEGMKAMLILAIATGPELLLLDEPFAGLDPVVRDDVLKVVVGALQHGERTVLCATHELDVAARIADRVAVLEGGAIVQHGSLAEVLGEAEPAAVPEALRRVMVERAEVASC